MIYQMVKFKYNSVEFYVYIKIVCFYNGIVVIYIVRYFIWFYFYLNLKFKYVINL